MERQAYWKQAVVLANWHFPAVELLHKWKIEAIRASVSEAMQRPVGMFTMFRKGF